MRLTGSRLLPLLLLTLLAALTFWLDREAQLGEQRRDGLQRHDPDYIVGRFTVRRFDADGQLQHLLTAQKMLHYRDDDSTEVDAPSLSYFSSGRRTDISAQQARLGPEGRDLLLSREVRVVQQGGATGPGTRLETSELLVYPDDELAHSDKPVTITQGLTVLKGSGLDADNRLRVFKLHGRAQAMIYRQGMTAP